MRPRVIASASTSRRLMAGLIMRGATRATQGVASIKRVGIVDGMLDWVGCWIQSRQFCKDVRTAVLLLSGC